MIRRCVTVALGVWLAASAQAWAAPWKIQPGVGVGQVQLGADAKQADAFFTRDDVIQENGVLHWVKYKEGIELHFDKGKVLEVIVHEPALASKQGPLEVEAEGGIKVGSTVQQMEFALGKGYTAQSVGPGSKLTDVYYAYTTKGIGLIARGGKIYEIAVWPRK